LHANVGHLRDVRPLGNLDGKQFADFLGCADVCLDAFASKRFWVSGSPRYLAISALSFAITLAGMPAGAPMAHQLFAS